MTDRKTEVWFRNPDLYIQEIVEIAHERIVFDRGRLIKKSIDPLAFCRLYYGSTADWRILVADENGSPVYGPKSSNLNEPLAVYPTWHYNVHSMTMLEEWCAENVGDDMAACTDKSVPPEFRPVFGQDHRVIIMNLPELGGGPGRRIMRELAELQHEYPEVKLHIHGTYALKTIFGNGFGAIDYEARVDAAKKKIVLGNCKVVPITESHKWKNWIALNGVTVGDLDVPRNRCMFNMKSMLWAGENFNSENKFAVSRATRDTSPSAYLKKAATAPTTISPMFGSPKAQAGDKYLCDDCSLAPSCKFFRAGQVCSLPGSEMTEFTKMFETRDPTTILDGMGKVLESQMQRLQTGMEAEEIDGELDPEVTKVASVILTHSAKLAKMLNPALNGGPKIGVFVQGQVVPPPTVHGGVAAAIAHLEAQGIPRSEITEDMIATLLGAGGGEVVAGALG